MLQLISTRTVAAAAISVALCAIGGPAKALIISDDPDNCAFNIRTGLNEGTWNEDTRTCLLDHDVQGLPFIPMVVVTSDTIADLGGNLVWDVDGVLPAAPGAGVTNGRIGNSRFGVQVIAPGSWVSNVSFTASPEPCCGFEDFGPAVGVNNASNVVLSDLSFVGYNGITVERASDVTLTGLKFENMREIVQIQLSSGVSLYDTKIETADFPIQASSAFGLFNILGSDDVTVMDSRLDATGSPNENRWSCMVLSSQFDSFSGEFVPSTDITLDHFRCQLPDDTSTEAISIIAASDVEVLNSRFDGGLWASIDFFLEGPVLFENNRFYHLNSRVGIVLDPIPDDTVVLRNNRIDHDPASGTGFWGILRRWDAFLPDSGQVIFEGNTTTGYRISVCDEEVSGTNCGLP